MTDPETIIKGFLLHVWNREPWRIVHIDREDDTTPPLYGCPTREETERAIARYLQEADSYDATVATMWEEEWVEEPEEEGAALRSPIASWPRPALSPEERQERRWAISPPYIPEPEEGAEEETP